MYACVVVVSARLYVSVHMSQDAHECACMFFFS